MSPLSLIYGAATGIRNRLYDRGIFESRKLVGPVISVGNLSAGGAGKTPFVVLLGELLKSRGIGFDVLSRGYGRRTRGVMVVDPAGPAQEFGDEPLLIARQLGCPVVVGENRHDAGQLAEAKFGTGWHILDDGFQHRALARDFDIVLLTPADLADSLLPQGRLREPLSAAHRADAIVLTGDMPLTSLRISGQAVWRLRRGIYVEDAPKRAVVFCGIARPNAFCDQLRASGLDLVATKFYRDHHQYTMQDVRGLMRIRDKYNADGFITTEKDMINLGQLSSELPNLAVARVTMELDQPDAALDTLLRVVRERRVSA